MAVRETSSCPSQPPTITWTPKNYTHFKVFVGLTPDFRTVTIVPVN